MNDYRGLLIKKQRKELDISLEALSHGVCSPSYLSKIENNILVANDDIYNLLFKKLGISTMDTIKEEKIKQMVAPDKKTLKKSVKSMFFMVQTRYEVETIKY